jgi:hypothetical protein
MFPARLLVEHYWNWQGRQAFAADLEFAGLSSDLGDLPQRHGVHAITQTAWGRAIGEDVAQVGVTSVADGFDALQKRRPVKPVGNDILLDWLCEGWPARMRLKFLRRIEKDGFATKAGIDSRLKEAAHFRAKGTLRSGLGAFRV